MRHGFSAAALAVLAAACAHSGGEPRDCPSGVLRPSARGRVEEQQLARLGEAPLCPTSGESYRLILEPPLGAPWSVRAERNSRGWHLEAKELRWGGRMALRREHEVLASELDAVLADLEASGFWGASPPRHHPGYFIDGSAWTIEAVRGGEYRVVDLRGSDFEPDQPEKNQAFRRAAIELLRVSGIDADIANTY